MPRRIPHRRALVRLLSGARGPRAAIAVLIALAGCRRSGGPEGPPAADVVWIERTGAASSAQAAREPDPARRRAPPVHRAGRQPHHFWYLHVDEVAERREWVRVDPATWEERYPSGAVLRFRVLGRSRDEGRAGVVVRRMPDQSVDVLIPDVDSELWPATRVAPDGEWHDLGPMHLIE